jgi:gas vesicle protein
MERTDIGKFMVGVSVGAAAALLLAPYSGKDSRCKLSDTAADGAAHVKDYGESVRGAVIEAVEHTKDDIARHKAGIAQAIKRGTEEYKRIVNEHVIA